MEQVRLFLQDKAINLEGSPALDRKVCLSDFRRASKAGLLSATRFPTNEEIARPHRRNLAVAALCTTAPCGPVGRRRRGKLPLGLS
jgi:hypothetical protein